VLVPLVVLILEVVVEQAVHYPLVDLVLLELLSLHIQSHLLR
jgi:hypothetical protein